MSENRSPFAARLKSLRESAGLTQQDLASKAGMQKLGVAKLEQGLSEPTWATVQALAKAFDGAVGEFVVEDGETAENKPAQMGRPRKAPAIARETRSTEGQASETQTEKKTPGGCEKTTRPSYLRGRRTRATG